MNRKYHSSSTNGYFKLDNTWYSTRSITNLILTLLSQIRIVDIQLNYDSDDTFHKSTWTCCIMTSVTSTSHNMTGWPGVVNSPCQTNPPQLYQGLFNSTVIDLRVSTKATQAVVCKYIYTYAIECRFIELYIQGLLLKFICHVYMSIVTSSIS